MSESEKLLLLGSWNPRRFVEVEWISWGPPIELWSFPPSLLLGASNLVVEKCPKLCARFRVPPTSAPIVEQAPTTCVSWLGEYGEALVSLVVSNTAHRSNGDVLPFTRKELRETNHRVSIAVSPYPSSLHCDNLHA